MAFFFGRPPSFSHQIGLGHQHLWIDPVIDHDEAHHSRGFWGLFCFVLSMWFWFWGKWKNHMFVLVDYVTMCIILINDDHDDHCYCNCYRYRYYHYCCSGQGIASPLKLAVSTQSPPARAARSSNLASEIRARWMSPSEWIPEPYEIPSGVSPVARKCPIN